MPDKCSTEGCGNEAAGLLVINVPATGWPIDMHKPLSFILGIKTCDQCLRDCNVKDFLNGDIKEVIEIATRGRCAPDYERAFLSLEKDLYKLDRAKTTAQ